MAETGHLSAELFRRFLEGQLAPAERRAVVRHLLGDCPECRALVARLTSEGGFWSGPKGGAAEERDYAEAFQSAATFATRLARDVAEERLRG